MAGAPDISYWLNRKYALQQQEANATTQNAATNAISANAAAALANARTALLPAESAATIAEQGARSRNLDTTTSFIAPLAQSQIGESTARVGLIGAQTGQTREATRGMALDNTLYDGLNLGSLSAIGRSGGLGVLSPARTITATDRLPARRAGETSAAYLDRVNGF